MKQTFAWLFIACCITGTLSCTKNQEPAPASSFINLEIGLRSVDQKASYTVLLDEEKILDNLKTTSILNKVMVADTLPHHLVLKNNRRSTVIDTVIRLSVPAARYSVVETDTTKAGKPLFIKTDGNEGDVPKGRTQPFMAWKKSPYYPTPHVALPDSLQVLIYKVDETGAISKPPTVFNIPVNGNITKAPQLLVNDPEKISYILLFKNYKTGKFIPAMGNTAVGNVFDWTAGILLTPIVEKTSRYAYFDLYYGNQGGGMYSVDMANMLEY